ncbi:MAG: hypothetical protein DRG59_07055 [Deltaproteobacteria bacterium]|nr:MAG: hypothetical protein DRG83_09645 [Deltaproteobacteria bacterium]RLB06983.1 MAG: hypothetical protein DRG59_07055 [Deltaproteobacteria bacterium]
MQKKDFQMRVELWNLKQSGRSKKADSPDHIEPAAEKKCFKRCILKELSTLLARVSMTKHSRVVILNP